MYRDEKKIASLCKALGLDLDCYNFQFLWLMPIIEVMWADGHCQQEEVETLLHHIDRFVDLVNPDVPQITKARARRFFQPLLEPSAVADPAKRASLSQLVDQIIQDLMEPARRDKRLHLLQICWGVAKASHSGSKEVPGRQISQEEEHLLKDLIKALKLGDPGQ